MSWVRALVCVIQHGTCRGCCSARPEEREHRHRVVARLLGHHRKIDAAPVDARRRAGLQPPDRQLQLAQPSREADRRRIAGAAALVILQADVDQAGQERAGRQHDRARGEAHADLRDDADDAVAVEHQIVDSLLKNPQVRLVLQARADRLPVQHAVGLRARRAHRRALARIEDPELDARLVGGRAPSRRPARRPP